mmetsp:Transcript_7555/g.5443  ORF Transcript_7555/g.5443 Transcript_7555/m.5443 type:complete len:241 (-) Transcript_7555:8077-8799(-)
MVPMLPIVNNVMQDLSVPVKHRLDHQLALLGIIASKISTRCKLVKPSPFYPTDSVHQYSTIVMRQLQLVLVGQPKLPIALQTLTIQSILNHSLFKELSLMVMKVPEVRTEEPFLLTWVNGASLVKFAQAVMELHALLETTAMTTVLLRILHSVPLDTIVIKMAQLLMERRRRDLQILQLRMEQFARLDTTALLDQLLLVHPAQVVNLAAVQDLPPIQSVLTVHWEKSVRTQMQMVSFTRI